jgi:hypothetical protein
MQPRRRNVLASIAAMPPVDAASCGNFAGPVVAGRDLMEV